MFFVECLTRRRIIVPGRTVGESFCTTCVCLNSKLLFVFVAVNFTLM